jgi:hypothetical protein
MLKRRQRSEIGKGKEEKQADWLVNWVLFVEGDGKEDMFWY